MILAIETSVESVGVALGDGSGVRASAVLRSDRRHAESLAPMIDFVRQQSAVELAELSAVAVDVGPGLFTGLRVGMATAASIAWALGLPTIGVCSLDVLAHSVRQRAASGDDTVIATALDARRGEVYWAVHRSRGGAGLERLVEPRVTPPEDLAVHLRDRGQAMILVGTGFIRHVEHFAELPAAVHVAGHHGMPSVESLLEMAVGRAGREEWDSPEALEPMYLRAPDAEINWATRVGR